MKTILTVLRGHRKENGFVGLLETAQSMHDRVWAATGGLRFCPNGGTLSRKDLESEVGPNVVSLLVMELERRGYRKSEYGGYFKKDDCRCHTLLSAMENEWGDLR